MIFQMEQQTAGTTIHSVDQLVRELRNHFCEVWWSCPRDLPDFGPIYTAAAQVEKEKQFDRMIDGLIFELKHFAPDAPPAAREALVTRMRSPALRFAQDALRLEPAHFDALERYGLFEALQSFARMARRFDPDISGADIYQAGRNVMTANLLQLLFGLPAAVTPSVFAYSMLYPYSDNYIDDASIPRDTKRSFNQRFQRRLLGEPVAAANRHEAVISELVGMIEAQYPRRRFPQVWESLLAIHAAQARSLRLVAPGASPYELDVLGITFEKGGTSVLADGYLVAGDLSSAAAAFCFGYGCFTQLMDDLEDVETDREAGQQTIFTQTLPHWKLDSITNRMVHFGRSLTGLMSAFDSPASATLRELIERSLDPVLIDIMGRAGAHYSRETLQRIEQHMPFRFAAVKKQRRKLERRQLPLAKLIDALL